MSTSIKKSEAIMKATYGSIDAVAIASVARNRRSIKLRFSIENIDGRALDSILRAAKDAARNLAASTKKQIELHSSDGCLIDTFEP